MSEKPREYKQRIDKTRAKRRINRDKLIECIQKYELVDEKYKVKTEQEILANFEKNEKAEKSTELYIKIGKELPVIDLKYLALEELKKDLEEKLDKKQTLEKKLREQKFDGKDKTTVNMQMINMQKIEAELEELGKEIEDLQNEIKNRENEINEIEETYGKKIEDEETIQEDNTTEQNEKQIKSKNFKKPEGKTLSEYRQNVILNLRHLNECKDEIIKLLQEGIGIDDNIRKEIEEEITIRYTEYEKELQGSLRMKAAEYMNKKDKIGSELNFKEELVYHTEIGGKSLMILKNNLKYRLVWGNEQCGEWFDSIDQLSLREIGGKPLFKAIYGHFEYVIRGNQQCGGYFFNTTNIIDSDGKPVFVGDRGVEILIVKGKTEYKLVASYGEYNINTLERNGKYYLMDNGKINEDEQYDHVGDVQEIGGKPCFIVKKNGKCCIMSGNEQYSDWYEYIDNLQEIGGKPCFRVKKDGKQCIILGNEYSEWFDEARSSIDIGGKPCFRARKEGEGWCIMRGNEQQCAGFHNITDPKDIGGKPCSRAKKDGKNCIIRGNEQQGEWFDNIQNLQEIGGKPCFRAKKDGKECVMWGNEQQGDLFDEVRSPVEIGGKPCFIEKKNGKHHVMWGSEKLGLGDGFDKIQCLEDIGGIPCFSIKHDGKAWLKWGAEDYSAPFDRVANPVDIGGKPCFHVGKDGKQCIIWGKEQYSDWFDEIAYYVKEIGGKLCFEVKKYGKQCIIWGKEQYSDWFDDVWQLIDVGGKPYFKAKIHGEGECIMQGKEQYSDWFTSIYDIKNIGGKLALHVGKEGRQWVIRGDEQQGDFFNNTREMIEIGGKPAFKGRKDGKYCIMWGSEQQGGRFDEIGGKLLEIGGKPCFEAKRDGKRYVVRGNVENVFPSEPSDIKYDGKNLIVKIKDGPIKSVIFNESENNSTKDKDEINPENLKTKREKRENLILKWYQRKLIRDELLNVIESLEDIDKGNKDEIRKIIFEDFYINYENDKKNDEFKDADDDYKKLKKLYRKNTKNEKELKSNFEDWKPEMTKISERLGNISSVAMKLENGSFRRKRELKKTKVEWNDLEKRLNEILNNAQVLKEQRYKALIELYKFEKEFGFKKDRKLVKKGKEIEKYEGDDLKGTEYDMTLKRYKDKYISIIKEKQEYFNKLIETIREIDMGISKTAINKVINILKGIIEQKIEMGNEGDELLKQAQELEKYINDNKDEIENKLGELEKEIQDKEKKLEELQQKESSTTDINELMKIRKEEFNLKNDLIQINEEYEKIKFDWNEKIRRYQGDE